MGQWKKRSTNVNTRANGEEPLPGDFAGVKRWARYLKRTPKREIKIKNPGKYLHSYARFPGPAV